MNGGTTLEHTDYSEIEKSFLKENYLLGLNFPGKGIVLFRISAREIVNYIYNEINELGVDEFRNYDRLGIASFNVSNAFKVLHENTLYQIFYGIEPSAVRLYPSYPVEVPRGNLEVRNVFTKGLFGFRDGFQSPFPRPSTLTETFVPYNTEIGWSIHNPLTYNAKPLINFVIAKYNIDLICDGELISRVLSGKKEARIATIGGVASGETYKYDVKQTWGIDPIPLDATNDEINGILQAMRPVQYRGKGP